MLEFIAEYWLEFAFGLVAAGLGVACKKIYALYVSEKNTKKTQERESLMDDFRDMMTTCQLEVLNKFSAREEQLQQEDVKIRKDLENLGESLTILKDGMLSLQGREFREDCRELLKEGHVITLMEYETLVREHQIYNSLGGNHRGDALFHAAEQKYRNSLKNNVDNP